MHNVEKLSNIILHFCGVKNIKHEIYIKIHIINIMHESGNPSDSLP